MGDVSSEPSMEEILSSIKRIIAEEGEAPVRSRRAPRPAEHDLDQMSEGVLELSDPIAPPAPSPPTPRPPVQTAAHVPAARMPPPAPTPSAIPTDPILSQAAESATRGSIEALSRLVVKPAAESDGTLEGLVRDMLRPMLRDWLDTNLPGLVETIVQREIAKITGARGG